MLRIWIKYSYFYQWQSIDSGLFHPVNTPIIKTTFACSWCVLNWVWQETYASPIQKIWCKKKSKTTLKLQSTLPQSRASHHPPSERQSHDFYFPLRLIKNGPHAIKMQFCKACQVGQHKILFQKFHRSCWLRFGGKRSMDSMHRSASLANKRRKL